jgi:hypothetical protein
LKNFKRNMKLYFFVILIFICLKKIISITDLDKDEKNNCMAIAPEKPDDCYNNSNYTFSSLVCCYFQMATPSSGNICVPMPISALGGSGNVTTTLPVKINLTGFYSCHSSTITLNGLTIFFIIAFLFF